LSSIVQNGIVVNREGFSQSINHLGSIKNNTETNKVLVPAERKSL